MTPDQLKSLRALCESTVNQTGPTVFGSAAWYRGRAIELAQAVPALIEEVEKLRRDMASPLKLCIGQRDAALDREDALRAQLSAVTAARDEAQTDTAVIARIVGVNPDEPGQQRLLVEVAEHVRSTFESHRRLAHENVKLREERDEAVKLLAKATHGGNITRDDTTRISALIRAAGVEP